MYRKFKRTDYSTKTPAKENWLSYNKKSSVEETKKNGDFWEK